MYMKFFSPENKVVALFSTTIYTMSESTPPSQMLSMAEPCQLSAIQANTPPATAATPELSEPSKPQATTPTNATTPPPSPHSQLVGNAFAPEPVAHVETPTTPAPKPVQPSGMNVFDPHCPLTVDGGVGYLGAPQSWAERNPTAPEQPPSRPAVKLTDAAKATKKITCEANKKAVSLLDVDIEKFHKWQDDEIEKVAKMHSKKVSEIDALINHHINYKSKRLPSMANALTHMQLKKMNAGMYLYLYLSHQFADTLPPGKDVGDRSTLSDIQKAKDASIENGEITPEVKAQAMTDLVTFWLEKSQGVRITGHAAACDVFYTMLKVEELVSAHQICRGR